MCLQGSKSMFVEFNIWQLSFGALVIAVAYFIRGLSGFGSGLIAIPLLSIVLPIQIVVPMVVLLDFIGSAAQGVKNRSAIQWYFILPLIPFALIGVLAGLILLHQLSTPALYQTMGAFIILFSLYLASDIRVSRHRSILWVMPAGLFGGMSGTLLGMGGPFYASYMRLQGLHPFVFKANFAIIFLLDGSFRLTGYAGTGMIDIDLLRLLVVSVPIMLLAMLIGGLLQKRLQYWTMKREMRILAMASGIALIIKSFVMPI